MAQICRHVCGLATWITWLKVCLKNQNQPNIHMKKTTRYVGRKQRSCKVNKTKNKKTNSMDLSPQANYTDWATAICRRNLVPTFVDRGVSCGQHGRSPTVINLCFLDPCKLNRIEYARNARKQPTLFWQIIWSVNPTWTSLHMNSCNHSRSQ
jgi:hypothetical protein